MLPRLRTLVASLCGLLIAFEGAGVARAHRAEAAVRCCCGPHAAPRPCHCLKCPAHRAGAADHDVLSAPSSCAPHAAGGVLHVLAVLPSPPALLAPTVMPRSSLAALAPPSVEPRTERPPP